MDTIKKIESIEKAIAKSNAIMQLVKTPQFEQYLLPALRELSQIKAIDPSTYKTREQYQYELMIANAEAFAIQKFLNYLENQESFIKAYTQQLYTLRLQNESGSK